MKVQIKLTSMYFQLTSAMIIYILVWKKKTNKRCCIAGKYGTLAWMGRLQKKNIYNLFIFISLVSDSYLRSAPFRLNTAKHCFFRKSTMALIAFRLKRCQGYSRTLSIRKTRLQKIKTKVIRINLLVACVFCSQLGQCYNLSEIHILENIYKFKVALFTHEITNNPKDFPVIWVSNIQRNP